MSWVLIVVVDFGQDIDIGGRLPCFQQAFCVYMIFGDVYSYIRVCCLTLIAMNRPRFTQLRYVTDGLISRGGPVTTSCLAQENL